MPADTQQNDSAQGWHEVTIGRARLILGDSREVLPTVGSVDLVCTDPPYGIGDDVGGYGREGRTILNDGDLTVCHAVLEACLPLLDDGYLMAFYSERNAPQFLGPLCGLFHYTGGLVWDKRAPGMGGALRYQHENIALFSRAGSARPLGNCFSILSYYREGKLHPHEKPLGLMKKLLEIGGGQTVLDPFMGSGSTGCAAVQMGRDFIGIELDPAHFEVACRRLDEAQRQGDMFLGDAA